MINKKSFVIMLGLILTSTTLAGCFNKTTEVIPTDSEEITTPIVEEVPVVEETPIVEEAPVKEFKMESSTDIVDGKYFPKFSLKDITVKKGDRVIIKIKTISGEHDFKIDKFNVFTETPLNEEMTVEFVADKVGSFVYYCTKPGHRANGHWGTLTVVE